MIPRPPSGPDALRLGQVEFIALVAMLFATIALSIDAMLPALPQIAAELSPADPNRAQLILTSFVLGMGIGTLFAGPLSDSFGRKTVIVAGSLLYCAGALLAWISPTLDSVLAARLVMGIGAAGPRIVALALVRDMYSGREMARVVSFATMVFTLVPAIAPMIGAVIMGWGGWRSIFPAFLLFSGSVTAWLILRQPETLPPARRRPLQAGPLLLALREVLAHPLIRRAIVVMTLSFACLFGTLSSTQQIFDQTYGRGDEFPFWFAVIALCSGSASLLNARLVMRLGMRRVVTGAFALQLAASAGLAGAALLGLWPDGLPFAAYLAWTIGVFFMAGLTIGNLNALGLEPVGHIAGMAASVIGAISTVASVALAVPVGLAFDGTALPLMLAVAGFAALALAVMQNLRHHG
jgi:DHA1 family bicyclomycin/chloramphenicol resistance-like MFS transporter